MRLILGLVGIALAGIVVVATLAALDYNAFLKHPVDISESNREFIIENGWTARRVSQQLVAQNIIDKHWWFDLHARLSDKASQIKSGEYLLEPGMTPPLLLDAFLSGQSVQYSHAIIEGSTFKEVLQRLVKVEHLTQEIPNLTVEQLMKEIGKPDQHPEGLFFSDTYSFPRGSSDIAFLQRAAQSLDKVLEEEWLKRAEDLPLSSSYEALILASIVEKETAVAAERPLIAGVFISRLRKKMRLQTDPTVIYGMGDSYDGNIRRTDLRTDTPYNTYTRAGLPPTPIAMVGREAIQAVMHPETTTALYFVAKGDGTHKFSDTVEEHNAAVRKYQLKK